MIQLKIEEIGGWGPGQNIGMLFYSRIGSLDIFGPRTERVDF